MKYLKFGILAILSFLALSLTSCEESTDAYAYIDYGEASVNMKSNPTVQLIITSAVEVQSALMMKSTYTFQEAKEEFDEFIQRLKKEIDDQHEFSVLEDSWVDLILHWSTEDKTYTSRLTLEPTAE